LGKFPENGGINNPLFMGGVLDFEVGFKVIVEKPD
jgi:hypothetical protein